VAQRRPRSQRVSNPPTERLVSGFVAAAAYLAATETITDNGRRWEPWLREIGIALALAFVAYVVHLLAQLAGAAVGRLSLVSIVLGFGGRKRLVERPSRDIVLRRWPPRVGLGWVATGPAIRLRLWLPSAVPVAVFAVVAVAARVHGYANGWTVDPWRSVGGMAAAALALAVVPWRYGADRHPSTALLLWRLPRMSGTRVRAIYAPYADARLRGPLLALGRAVARQYADIAARVTAELVAAGASPDLVRRGQALVHGLRGEYLEGAQAAARNLDDLERADVSDFQLLFACVLAGLEAGQPIPSELVDLTRGHVGNLAEGCERDDFAEKYALLALHDGKLRTAERWVEHAISWATNDVVEGDALLTLARLRTLQGRPDEARRALDRARTIHPNCPRWQAVLKTSQASP